MPSLPDAQALSTSGGPAAKPEVGQPLKMAQLAALSTALGWKTLPVAAEEEEEESGGGGRPVNGSRVSSIPCTSMSGVAKKVEGSGSALSAALVHAAAATRPEADPCAMRRWANRQPSAWPVT